MSPPKMFVIIINQPLLHFLYPAFHIIYSINLLDQNNLQYHQDVFKTIIHTTNVEYVIPKYKHPSIHFLYTNIFTLLCLVYKIFFSKCPKKVVSFTLAINSPSNTRGRLPFVLTNLIFSITLKPSIFYNLIIVLYNKSICVITIMYVINYQINYIILIVGIV